MKHLIFGLLVIYGIVLALVSYYVFSPKIAPKIIKPVTIVDNGISFISSTPGTLSIGADKSLNLGSLQIVMEFPYSPENAKIKGVFVPSDIQVAQAKTQVSQDKKTVIVTMAGFWMNGKSVLGSLPILSLTISGKPVSFSSLVFDKGLTKVLPLKGVDLIPINFKII